MAPSQVEHQTEQSLGQGYTHKKFNCGYSHKKLGMRLRQREGQLNNKENQENSNEQTQQQQKEITKKSSSSSSSSRNLFRPYALGDDTPRKRKVSRDTESPCSSSSSSSSSSSDEESSPVQPQYIISSPQSSAAINNLYYQPQFAQQIVSPASPVASVTTCSSPALSPNSYAQRLQRQRAALYMRYMQQFHTGGQLQNSTEATVNFPATSYQPMGYPNVTAPMFNTGC